MFNGEYRSISTIIENVLRDTDYYNEVDQNDITEWAVRAMELIGAPLVYIEDIVTKDVVNYRAELPDNVREIIGVRDHYSRNTLTSSTDSWVIGKYDSTQEDISIPSDCDTPLPFPGENRKMRDKGIAGLFSYKVVNGWIFLDVKDGCIDILYTKFPTDVDGCLMIPDVDRYMLGVESYIIHKIDNKLFRKGIISEKIRNQSEQDWLWYVGSAHSKIVTPNYDEAESLKNQLKKIRTDGNAHDYGFEHMNLPTERKVQGNRRRY